MCIIANQTLVSQFRKMTGVSQSRTIGIRILVRPLVGKRTALLGTDRIDTTAILFIKHRARTVRAVLQHQPPTIRREVRLVGDEFCFAHTQMRGNPRYVDILQTDYALNAATGSAFTANKSGMVETEGLEPPTLTV